MQSTVQSVLNMKELRSTGSKCLEVPCQNNTFKDKPAFIKRLIKIPVARSLKATTRELSFTYESITTHDLT